MRAVLIATGYRIGLEPLIQHRPSPLIKIVDKPILVHIVEYLVKQGLQRFDVVLNHLPQKIEYVLGEGKRWGIEIIFHLARDCHHPFAPLKPILKKWGSERVILGQGDCLPRFGKDPFQGGEDTPILFYSPSKEWTGWGIIPANLLNEMPQETTVENLPSKISTQCAITTVHPFLSTQSFDTILHSNFRFISQSSHTGIYPSDAHMVELDVWIGHAVSLHPGIKIQPPIFIGENCQIKEDVHLGPNAIIEDHCIIDKGSTIRYSLISRKSYVGEGLTIHNSIVDRNLLVNLSHHSVVAIQDDFILSELTPPPFWNYPFKWLERFFALLLIALLTPFYLLMKISCIIKKTEMLQLPAADDKDLWKTFEWLHFVPKNEAKPTHWQEIFLRLPVLLNVVRGQVHFVGVSPRTKEETLLLPQDWRKLYLKSKVGLISLAGLDVSSTVTPDDVYAAEAYYTTHMGLRFDITLLFRWIKQKFLSFSLFFRGSHPS